MCDHILEVLITKTKILIKLKNQEQVSKSSPRPEQINVYE